jgi:tetratricopeptide (TPR) repeat protein
MATASIPASAASESAAEALGRARKQFDKGGYANAVATLEAIDGAARDASTWFWIGRAAFELADFSLAIRAFERTVALMPNDAEFHRWLGRAYGEQADRDRSLFLARKVRQQFEAAVRLDPSSVDAHRDLLQFYLQAPRLLGGSDDNARKEIAALARLDAAAGHLARAAYAVRHQKLDAAAAEYRAALAAHPATAAQCFEAADFFAERRDAAGLRAALEAAAALSPGEPALLYFRGVLDIVGGGSAADAAASLDAYLATPARSDRPAHALAHEWLGRAYERSGRPAEAIAEYRKALAADPGRRSAADALERLGAK